MLRCISYIDENGERKTKLVYEEDKDSIRPPTWEERCRWAFWSHVEDVILAFLCTAGVTLLTIIGTILILY